MSKMLNIERRKEEKQSETSKAKYFLVLLLLLFFIIIINFGKWERPVEVKGAKGVIISYDANGGMGAPKEQTKEEGKELKISTTKPVKVGYKFLGWTKVRNSQEIDFKPGSLYKEDVSRTLYASWNANSYKLTFEANGGSTVLPKMVTYDKEYGTLTESKKDGYIFEGWYFDNETFNDVVEKTDIVKITSDTTIYAKWEKEDTNEPISTPEVPTTTPTSTPTQKPTVTPSQTPTATNTATPSQKPTATPTIKPTSTPIQTPTQAPTAAPTATVTPTQEPTQEPTQTPTLAPVAKIEVRFESNAGINIESKTVEYGKAYGELPEPTYAGYTFEGWYLDNETFNKKIDEISIVKTNRNHTLYGGWKYKLVEVEIQAVPTEWTNKNVEVTITPKEEIVNGAKIEYKIGNGEWKEYTGTFEVEENCTITARTAVGQTKGQEASKEITNIDKIAPETASIGLKETTTKSIEIDIKGQDTLSGIKEIRVYVNNALRKVYVYEENVTELKEEEYKIEGLKQNAEYEIYIEVEDVAGNVRSTIDNVQKITTEKLPTVEISHTPTIWTNENVDVTIEFSNDTVGVGVPDDPFETNANDSSDGITIEWQMEGDTEWFPYEGPFAIGENTTVYARSTDGSSKGETTSHAIENIDTTNPTANITADDDETTNSAEIEITGVDLESGIASIAIYVDGELEYTKADYTGNAVGSPVRDEQKLTYTIEDLTAGTEYEIYTVVTDKAGNIVSTENTPTTITTKDLPVVEINHAPITWTNGNVDVTIEFVNNNQNGNQSTSNIVGVGVPDDPTQTNANNASNGTTIEYKIGDGNWQTYTSAFEVTTNSTVYARSAYGNEKGETAIHAIENIDKTNPTANITADDNETTTSSSEIEITGVDLESGIASIAIYVDGELEYTKADYTGNAVGSPARDEQKLTYTIEDLTAGTEYEIYTVVTDKAGNIVSTENTPTTITTKDLPAVIIEHTPVAWTNDNVDVTIAFANGTMSDATIEYKIGDGQWQTYTSAFEVDANNTIYARSAYGEEKGEAATHAVQNIDTTNPTANIIADEDSTTRNSAEIEITGVDNESGIASIEIYVDEEIIYTKADYTGNTVGSPARDEKKLTYTLEDLTAGTEYEIYTIVTDKAGNTVSTENTPTIITTKDLPTVEITHAPTKWTNKNVDVTIEIIDNTTSDVVGADDSALPETNANNVSNGTTIEYKIGDGNWQTYTSAFEVTTNSTVYARSAYGEEKGETAIHAIENIDITNPTANITADANETTTNSAEIEITAVDLESGIASIAIYVDGTLTYTKADYTGNAVGSPARDEQTLTYTIEDLTAGTEYEIYTVVTDKAGNTVSTENTPTTITTKDLPAVTISHAPEAWTNENVDVTIEFVNEPMSDGGIIIQWQMTGDTEWFEYEDIFAVGENTIIYARSTDGTNVGETEAHEITNIDKVNPKTATVEIDEDTITTSSAEIEIKGQDEESGLKEIRLYVNEELHTTYKYDEYPVSLQTENITIENLPTNETSKIKIEVEDRVGNVSSSEEGDIVVIKTDIARVVELGTVYYSIKDALEACEENKELFEKFTIEILENTEETIVVDQGIDVTIDLQGKTVTGKEVNTPTLTITEGNKVVLLDTVEGGSIVSTDGTAVRIDENGAFIMGIDEKPISLIAPKVQGKTKGIEVAGTFNFYDGVIYGEQTVDGLINEMPLLYNGVTVDNVDNLKTTLGIISNVEARIGRKTYMKLEDAIADAGTLIGEDGSQVEIVLVKDVTKTEKVIIDETKNILLNLDGYILTTTAADYVIENNGELEITSTENYIAKPVSIGNLTANGDYYFENVSGVYKSNNTGVHSKVANSYIKLDLTNVPTERTLTLKVNAEISSQSGSDYGYATVNTSTSAPAYSTSTGRFIYISGTVAAQDYTTGLAGGQIYYLHLGYRKNGSTHTGADIFTVNSIELTDENGNNINGEVSVREKAPGKITSTTYDTILNNGEMKVSDGIIEIAKVGTSSVYKSAIINEEKLEIAGGTLQSGKEYTNIVQNAKTNETNGDAVVNLTGGTIKTLINESTIIGIRNYTNGVVEVTGGTISTYDNGINSVGTLKIEGGNIKGTRDAIYIANTVMREVCVKNATIIGSYGIYNDSSLSDLEIIIDNVNISGGNNPIYNNTKSKMIVTNSRLNGTIYNRQGEIMLENSTLYGVWNYSSGTTNIVNSMVTGQGQAQVIENSYGGTINIENSYIESTRSYTVYNGGTGTINIKSGEIVGYSDKYTINNSSTGTINIGTKDGEVITEDLIIRNGHGIYNVAGGTVNFYDGKVIVPKAYDGLVGTISEVETGVDVLQTTDDIYNTYTLGINLPVAQVGDITYNSLQEAIEACDVSEEQITIILLKNIVTTRETVIDEGQNVKIDTNGHSILILNKGIRNNGKLEIVNGQGTTHRIYARTITSIITNNGELVIGNVEISHQSSVGTSSIVINTIYNAGKLIVNGGTISADTNYTRGISSVGELIVNSGTITGTGSSGGIGIITSKEGTTTINGGTITGDYALYARDTSNVEVNGGTITGDYGIIAIGTSKTAITGGTIEGNSYSGIELSDSALLEMKGGSINATSSSGTIRLIDSSTAIVEEGEIVGSYRGSLVENTATLIIKGGSIRNTTSGYDVIRIRDSAMLEMSGGEIVSEKGYGVEIYTTTARATITGGRVQAGKNGSTLYKGIENIGTLVLGEKIEEGIFETPSITNPEIVGTSYGVYNTGTFKFYDGIITGSGGYESIYGSVAEWEEGYEIIKTKNTEENTETAILANMPAAKVVETGVEYTSVVEAITASNTNNYTIQLLRSSVLVDSLTVAEEQNIVLDMAGYSLTGENEAIIINNGALKITNSTSESSRIENQLGEAIQNNERLTIEKVTIRHITGANRSAVLNTGEMEISSGTITNTVAGTSSNYMNTVYNAGTLTLNDGTITSSGNYTNTVHNTGTLTLNGGTVSATGTSYARAIYSTGETTVNDGSITGGTDSSGYGIYAREESTTTVTGGEVRGYYGIIAVGSSRIVITDGTIRGTANNGIELSGTALLEMKGGTIQGNSSSGTVRLIDSSTAIVEEGEIMGSYRGSYVQDTAKLIIKGGSIRNTTSGYEVIYIIDSAMLEMSGGEVVSEKGYGIEINSSTANATITGGRVSSGVNGSTIYSGILNSGILILGEKIEEGISETPSITNPEITGTKYGVYNTGTFKFYDGIITGSSNYSAIYGEVTEWEEGYEIIKTKDIVENTEIAILSNASAIKIVETNTEYSTLTEAIEACSTNEYTMQLLRDIVISKDAETITIAEGQNVTLDLAGHIITAPNDTILKNDGTFAITDSSESKAGKIENVFGTVLENTGTFKLIAGTLSHAITNGTTGNSTVNYKYVVKNIGNMIVENGTIIADTMHVIAVRNSGTITVNSGTITSTIDIKSTTYNVGIYNTGEVVVNGGKVSGESRGVTAPSNMAAYRHGYGYGIYNISGKVVITGGEIKSVGATSRSIYVTGTENDIEVSGGKITSVDEDVYCAEESSGTVKITGGELTGGYGIYANNTPNIDIVMTGGTITTAYDAMYLIGASKARIEGGKLKATSTNGRAIEISGTSIVEVAGGELSSEHSYVIYINSTTATAIITGGKVSSVATGSNKYSAISNKGTLVLGENNERVSTTSPEIVGTSYGISNTGTFKFYDGIIKGPSGAINGTVTEVADDHKVQNLDDGKIAILEVDAEFAQVAELNGVYYNTLDVAIASASSGAEQTIKICTDVNLNEGITIPLGKNIKIDLNGYVIRGIFEGALITNNGTLTLVDIIDTSTLLEGETIDAIVQNTAGIAIQNNGTLIVGALSRTVEETKMTVIGSTAGIVNGGSLTLNGGQVKGTTAISGNVATPRSGYTITTTTLENVETTKLTSPMDTQTDTSDVVGVGVPDDPSETIDISDETPAQYLISYDANGGENTPDAQYKVAGQGIELVGQPTREGFVFAGWSTVQTGTTPEYMPGETYEGDAILILYAIWE